MTAVALRREATTPLTKDAAEKFVLGPAWDSEITSSRFGILQEYKAKFPRDSVGAVFRKSRMRLSAARLSVPPFTQR